MAAIALEEPIQVGFWAFCSFSLQKSLFYKTLDSNDYIYCCSYYYLEVDM